MIHGDPETLRAFVAYAKGPAGTGGSDKEMVLLSAHRFIPYPEEYSPDRFRCTQCGHEFTHVREEDQPFPKCPSCQGNAKDGYNLGGYDWCVKNWGTKWGLYEVLATEDYFEGGLISYTFLTAWSPPVPVIQAMSKQFPSLQFDLDYFECGCGFMGSCEYENGQEVAAASAPYHGDRGG